MSLSDPAHRASLGARIQGVLLRPAAEWDRIDLEPATTGSLFTGYAMILAAIGPVCSAIGMVVFGFGVPGFATYHASAVGALATAVVTYVLALVSTFLVGLIVDALAPTFNGVKNPVQAMKVAVYGATASWVAGVFGLFPPISMLAILGLYSLYLFYVGLPKLMKTPADKALPYTAVVVLCYIVLAVIIGAVASPLRMMGGVVPGAGGVTVIGGNGVTVTGADGSTVKVGGALAGLAAAGQAMGAQARSVTTTTGDGSTTTTTVTSGAPAVSPDALKALLPASVAGYARGDVTAEGTALGGMNTSHARADYARGDAHFTLEVADTGGLAALDGLAAAMGVNTEKQTATGYEKVSTAGGRMVSEAYDRSARSGKYAVLQGRASVSAEGAGGVSMDDLKAAVGAVDPGRVAQLAHA